MRQEQRWHSRGLASFIAASLSVDLRPAQVMWSMDKGVLASGPCRRR